MLLNFSFLTTFEVWLTCKKLYILNGYNSMSLGISIYLDSMLKSRDNTLPTEVHLVKAMVFPVVMYGCESWTIKKTEHWRIGAFELWCWRRLLRVPWTAKRSNQSMLKEISPEYSLEGLMLKLKLQYFGHLTWRADSLEKTLMLGKFEGRRRREQQRMRWLDGITTQWTWVWVNSGSWWWTGRPGMLRFMGSQRAGHDWATELKTDIPLMVLQCRRPWLDSWASKIPCRRHRQSTPVLLGFPSDSVGKESTCNAGDPSLIPGSGSSPGEGIDYPLQYSWSSLMTQTIKNPPAMQETWVRSLGWEDPLEEGMATHSSILAWRIPKDRGAWRATVHRVTKSWTWLSD